MIYLVLSVPVTLLPLSHQAVEVRLVVAMVDRHPFGLLRHMHNISVVVRTSSPPSYKNDERHGAIYDPPLMIIFDVQCLVTYGT